MVVVKTRCGGHLGWQESPPPRKDVNGKDIASTWLGGAIGSWSDVAVADFIEALLDIRREDRRARKGLEDGNRVNTSPKLISKL